MHPKVLRLVRLVAVLAVAGVVVSGASAGASTQSAKPVKGGTLTLLKAAEQANGWDPGRMLGVPTNSEVPGGFAIYDVLFYEDYATNKIVGRLAQSLTSNDGITWTLKLRPGVKFSDGTALDAEAVRFNWARLADPNTQPTPLPQPKAPVAQIDSMTVVDATTLKITLKSVDPVWDRKVTYVDSTIASPTALKALGANFGTKPIGAGPFVLKEWIKDASQTFERNPNYWEQGKPYLDGVIVKFVPDDEQRLTTVQAGGGNVGQVFDPTYLQRARDAGLKTIPMAMPGGGWGVAFNTTKAPFDDVRIRQAFSLAIDRKAFNVTRRGGTELMIKTVHKEGTPYYDKTEKVPSYDLPAAQKLIDAYVAEKGGPVSFTWLSFNGGYQIQDAQLIQAQLTKLKNFDMKIEFAASSTVVARYTVGDYQMVWNGIRWNEPATDMLAAYMTGGGNNTMRYSNPQVDVLGNQLRVATDPKEKKRLTHEIVMQVLKDVPNTIITTYMSTTYLDKTVKNYVPYFDARPLLNEVWISKPKS